MSTRFSSNKWGLAALLPLAALALVAASSRIVTVYLPWEEPSPVDSQTAAVISSKDQSVKYPEGATYSATFTPIAVAQVDDYESTTSFKHGKVTAAPGAALWRVAVRVDADPEFVTTTCRLAVIGDDGVRYSAEFGKLENGEPTSTFSDSSCNPYGQLGPTADLATMEWQAATPDNARDPKYSLDTYFAVPTGVTPAKLLVDAGTPGRYWTVDLPKA